MGSPRANKKYYTGHKEQVKGEQRRRRDIAREYIESCKSVPCSDCGMVYPPYVMDFDHIRGDKSFSIGTSTNRGVLAIAKEILKCEVVCSNCHRERTHKDKYREKA